MACAAGGAVLLVFASVFLTFWSCCVSEVVPLFFLSAFGFARSLVRVDQTDLGLAAFIFELVVLCACVLSCASTVVIPTHQSPPQDDVHWRRMSDVAAAAAAAAVEEATPNPSIETVNVIQIAARAATAATATALCGAPVVLSTVPWGLRTSGGTAQIPSAMAASGCAHGVGAEQERGGAAHGRGGVEAQGLAAVWSSDGAAAWSAVGAGRGAGG